MKLIIIITRYTEYSPGQDFPQIILAYQALYMHSLLNSISLIIATQPCRDTLFFAVHVRGGVTVSKKEGGSGKINVQYPKRLLRIHDSREGFKAELCADTILPPCCAEYLSDSFHCRGNCNKYIENELTLYQLLNIIMDTFLWSNVLAIIQWRAH